MGCGASKEAEVGAAPAAKPVEAAPPAAAKAAAAEEEELVPVEELEKDKDMVAAATKIQAVHRGRAARKDMEGEEVAAEGGAPDAPAEATAEAEEEELVPVEELEKDKDMVAAATKIKAAHRGLSLPLLLD